MDTVAVTSSSVMTSKSPPSSSQRSVSISTPSKGSSALVEFKMPAEPPQKKKKVLEEDKFVDELEKIIQRDFFPDLEKLQAQNAYHNAVENNDIHMLRELYSKYSFGATPRLHDKSNRNTPSSFETPTPTGLGMGKGGVEPSPRPEATPTHLPMAPRPEEDAKSTSSKASKNSLSSLNLNTFLANYTSEDNQSFQEILENSDKKHKIKYSWVFGKEQEHLEKYAISNDLPSIESQAAYTKPLAVDSWTYKNLNYLMYAPDGAAYTPEEQVQAAKKVPKVFYQNTRFVEVPFKGETKSTPSTSTTKKPSTKIGVDGKEVESETPKVNGFSFVRTPSPTPGVEESPFLTWGEIEGTPFRLDGADTPIPVDNSTKPYRMLETTKREKIAMRLQEKVSEQYRDRKLKAIETAKHNLASPRPRSSLERLSTMSPAARRLVGSHFGSKRDKTLAASYTPKQATPKFSVVTPSPARSTGSSSSTPYNRTSTIPSSSPSPSSNPVPSRKSQDQNNSSHKRRAADFF